MQPGLLRDSTSESQTGMGKKKRRRGSGEGKDELEYATYVSMGRGKAAKGEKRRDEGVEGKVIIQMKMNGKDDQGNDFEREVKRDF